MLFDFYSYIMSKNLIYINFYSYIMNKNLIYINCTKN